MEVLVTIVAIRCSYADGRCVIGGEPPKRAESVMLGRSLPRFGLSMFFGARPAMLSSVLAIAGVEKRCKIIAAIVNGY